MGARSTWVYPGVLSLSLTFLRLEPLDVVSNFVGEGKIKTKRKKEREREREKETDHQPFKFPTMKT